MKRTWARRRIGLTLLLAGGLPTLASATTFVVAATADNGPGSLREAIHSANALPGHDTIVFQFRRGSGVQTISPLSSLPQINEAVTIDGTTRKGLYEVVLDGSAAGPDVTGLTVWGSDSVVRHLVIHSFDASAIWLIGSRNLIEDCRLGTDATGTVERGSRYGVGIGGAFNAVVGNLISGNRMGGIAMLGDSHRIESNLIGPDAYANDFAATGTSSQPFGIRISFGADNLLRGNLVAGSEIGITLDSDVTRTSVLGNTIGTTESGDRRLGSLAGGIDVFYGANSNWIGGVRAGEGNRIAFIANAYGHGWGGVSVRQSQGNTVRGNLIYELGPAVLAIDLYPPANGEQAAPILRSAQTDGQQLEVVGELRADPDAAYAVDFYSTLAAPASGRCDARVYLGAVQVITDAAGFAAFTFPSPVVVGPGEFVGATATSTDTGDTSEFSTCQEVGPGA